MIAFDDGTYGVVDFMTSSRNSEHIPLYGRRLHACAWALTNVARGKLALSPVSRLGLLVLQPDVLGNRANGPCALSGSLSRIEIKRDDTGFRHCIEEVLDILEQPTPPASCGWCGYR